jgi:LDH2 family malate/lactate/ureidoglycolate dehydrogenase
MGKPLPEGWALDENGSPSQEAPRVLANIVGKNGGGIVPLGGASETTGSHKGYGYGMVAEIFSSILSMGVTSNECCTFEDKTGICHGFAAIDLKVFGDADGIRAHFSDYLRELRESPIAEGAERIYTHGEKEVEAERDRRENGIQVNDGTMVELADLCQYLGLDFGSYFPGYTLPEEFKGFAGNY